MWWWIIAGIALVGLFVHDVTQTRWPILRGLFDWAYRIFARNRLRWTGREPECGCAPS